MGNMNETSRATQSESDVAWFCLRSQQKREHIAAANLRQISSVEVFSPRLRIKKLTRRGPAWFVESLFPNYLFVRFAFHRMLEEVKYTAGVSHIIRFGDKFPIVPDQVIEDLRNNFGEETISLSTDTPSEGEKVTITDPAFYGLQAVVLRVLPVKQRIQVLLDILGQTTMAEVDLRAVVSERQPLPETLLAIPECNRWRDSNPGGHRGRSALQSLHPA